jgi:hypothetical protein
MYYRVILRQNLSPNAPLSPLSHLPRSPAAAMGSHRGRTGPTVRARNCWLKGHAPLQKHFLLLTIVFPVSFMICLLWGIPNCCSTCSFTYATVAPAGHLQGTSVCVRLLFPYLVPLFRTSAGNASPLVHDGVGVPPPPRAGPGGLTKGSIPFCSGNLRAPGVARES